MRRSGLKQCSSKQLKKRRVDLAVHSLKDLLTEIAADFEIAAVTAREDPRDVFCSIDFANIKELPRGARVGTSSLRRQSQPKALRCDLDIYPLRGNIDTRLRKLEAGEYHALILAAAGLNRLGHTKLIREIISLEVICPAPGQGALAIESRAEDATTKQEVAFLNEKSTHASTTCERALLKTLGGGCQVPIGALAEVRNGSLHLDAVIASLDGSTLLRESQNGLDPIQLGVCTGKALPRRGGDVILEQHYGQTTLPTQP